MALIKPIISSGPTFSVSLRDFGLVGSSKSIKFGHLPNAPLVRVDYIQALDDVTGGNLYFPIIKQLEYHKRIYTYPSGSGGTLFTAAHQVDMPFTYTFVAGRYQNDGDGLFYNYEPGTVDVSGPVSQGWLVNVRLYEGNGMWSTESVNYTVNRYTNIIHAIQV